MTGGTTPITRRARRTRRRLRVTTALALVAFAALPLATLPARSLAQAAEEGTLGIDCHLPRRTPEGRLTLDGNGHLHRAMCEADRTYALAIAETVIRTRRTLDLALRGLPLPVWRDLVAHLETSDRVDTWTFTDAVTLNRLRDLSAAAPPGDPNVLATAESAHGRARFWAGGLFAASSFGQADPQWRRHVRARICRSGPRTAWALTWFDPAAVRARWTPRMLQRAAFERFASQSDDAAAAARTPQIVTAAGTLRDHRGRERAISADPAINACFSTVPAGALALAMTVRTDGDRGERVFPCDGDEVGRRRFTWESENGVYVVPETAILPAGTDHPDRGEPLLGQSPSTPLASSPPTGTDLSDPATDPPGTAPEFLRSSSCRTPRTLDAVRPVDCPAVINGVDVQGTHVRRFRFREVQNDPLDPFRIDWVPVMPDPLDPTNALGVIAPAGNPHPEWAHVTVFCEGFVPPSDAPPVPQPVEDWTPPDCPTQWGGSFDQGERRGYTQHFDYPAGWPKDDEEIRTIDDDCFNPVAASGTEKRPRRNCPAGHVGATIEARSFSWWNRDWAVPSRHAGGAEGDRSLGQAAGAHDGDPSQAGLDWWDVVTLVADWHVVANTCRVPSSGGDGDDDGGNSNSHGGNYDVDGDGVGDFDNEEDANAYNEHFGTPGSTVDEVENCGDCEGHGGSERPPSRPTNRPDDGGDDDDDDSSGGGGWG